MSSHDTNKFKTSPLGPIPIDWDVKDLSEIASVKRGRFSPRPRNDTRFYGGKIPFVQTGDVSNSNGRVSTFSQTLNEEGLKVSILFPKGTILITIAANIGHTAILDIDMACPDSLVGVICNKTTDNEYLNYQFQYAQKRIEHFAPGAQKNIGVDFLTTLPIVAPSFKEQRAISSTLLMWDQAIEKITQLIAAKEQRKKWLMQQLLTGKKRLKGFTTEWQISSLAKFIKPVVREVEKPKEPYLALGIRSHGKGTFLKPDEDPVKNEMEILFVVRENDLIVNITFAWEMAIAIVSKKDDGALVSHRFPTYTFIENHGCVNFFRFFMLRKEMKYALDLISPGGAGRNRVMSKTDFIKLQFLLPEYDEQVAIAEVLTAADKEINLLKQKLAAYKEQKKGLMQVLLTGKVRLKI